ncbi:MAG: hypothetical protein E5W86_02295 [Mesorhizobium sp.]|nr:MAG: hypothetical protein E5W86_02295 [Mesorhizobium sp.]
MSAASFPGEKLAALDFLRRTLIAMGHDEHWLVARLQVDDSPYEIIVQRKFDASWAEGWPT